jgi:hypothetical protein
MENEKGAIQRRLAEEAGFRQEKENILIELGGSPFELLASSDPERFQRSLDNALNETISNQQFRDPWTPLEDPTSNEETCLHDIHEVVPTPFNHSDEQNEYIQQEQRMNRLKKRNYTIYVSVVLILIFIIIASTAIIMLTKMSDSMVQDGLNVQCSIDRQKLIQCSSGYLEVPSCASKTFDELTKTLLKESETPQSYPCDASHFGLLAVAVAKVNANDQIDNIFQYWILAILYFALGGQDWRQDSNWLSGKSFCEDSWLGISCLDEGTVGTINLMSNNLMGTFPTEMALLSSLVHLQLSSNDVSGTLPSEIGSMQNLSRLELEDTQISGTIPSEIGLCQRLEHLDIIQANISGSIPTEIGKLSMLRELCIFA